MNKIIKCALEIVAIIFICKHLWINRKETKKLKQLINTKGIERAKEGNLEFIFRLQDRLIAYQIIIFIIYIAIAFMAYSIVIKNC